MYHLGSSSTAQPVFYVSAHRHGLDRQLDKNQVNKVTGRSFTLGKMETSIETHSKIFCKRCKSWFPHFTIINSVLRDKGV